MYYKTVTPINSKILSPLVRILYPKREWLLLAAMLELLHFSIWQDFGSPLTRALMLAHLGLFLIWQPVWRGDEKLTVFDGVLFIILTLGFVTWMNLWLLSAWLILLTGICGGRVIINRQERNSYMIILIFLVTELLIVCVPELFNIEIPRNVSYLIRILLPVLPLVTVMMPAGTPGRSLQSVDFLHVAATALLVGLLIAGSLLNMYRGGTDYVIALIESLIIIGVLLLLLSWMLSPRAGFSGFSQLWLRSVLNIGTPFERWLREIANLLEQQNSPHEFVSAAMEELVSLPWMSGVRWEAAQSKGEAGEFTKHETKIGTDEMTVSLYSQYPVGGALYLHCKLLVQIISHFYLAKLRERKLTQQTHLQAIHETGARVTHDIKNLLQSLQAMTSIIIHESDDADPRPSQQLLKKQLPSLTQRLQLALDKLQAPATLTTGEKVYLKDWWQDLQKRHNLPNTKFQADISGDPVIPAELFDSVMDNLMENLREKAQLESGLTIIISLYGDMNRLYLSVCDTGSKIPDGKAAAILKEPIKSDSGLGVGLYQVAQLAETLGYSLALTKNRNGNVCFELKSKHPSG